jgi:8-oxo-dGTP diphosphatase
MADVQLQFGERKPGLDYRRRPTAFGVAVRDGKVACVRIGGRGKAGTGVDLPGGALDPGEDEQQALAREFLEESGLKVRAGPRLGCAGQYVVKADGRAVNNLCAFYLAEVVGEDPGAKSEDDHWLVWLEPLAAITELRHPAHAWAVTTWLRRG